MSYEINVSKDGNHLFATHERSTRHEVETVKLTELFVEKFPESEGYKISVSYKPEIGYGTDIKDGNIEEQISQLSSK